MWETAWAAAGWSIDDGWGIGDSAGLADWAGCDMAEYFARRRIAEKPRQPLNLTMGHFGFNE
jgi:hypothetical protein